MKYSVLMSSFLCAIIVFSSTSIGSVFGAVAEDSAVPKGIKSETPATTKLPTSRPVSSTKMPQLHLGSALGSENSGTDEDEQMDFIRNLIEGRMRKEAFTDKEMMVIANIKEGVEPTQESGFYLMMDRVSKLPPIREKALDQFTEPSYYQLQSNTHVFRYHVIIRTEIKLHKIIIRNMANGGISRSPYWVDNVKERNDRPIYEIHGTVIDEEPKRSFMKPIIVYTDKLPKNLPEGKKLNDGEDGFKYEGRNLRTCKLAGVLYKTHEISRLDKQGKIKYPVLISWWMKPEVVKVREKEESPTISSVYGSLIIGALVVIGVGIFIYIKMSLSKTKSQSTFISSNYHPLRDIDRDDEIYLNKDVDPDLAAAAREFRKERGIEDPPGHQDDTE